VKNGMRTICPVALVGLLVTGAPGLAGAQSPPLWGKLPPGPHAVGYRTSWQLDYSRRYNTTFDDKTTYAPGKAPRPILVNLWYPAGNVADAKRMPHRDYLDVRSDDPRLAKFATKLADYNRGVIAKEVMGKPPAGLTDREKALLDRFLDTPTACVRDAAPAPGPFPLVIYHAGAGSSYEDNAVLCEFLASHGFVVLGSAFQEGGGKSFNTDNREGSAQDLAFLIAHARQLPNVDWGRVGLVGHSAGAQAALVFGSQAGSAMDAVVSLDTTQDYQGVSSPLWDFPAQVMRNEKNFTCPLLMVAGPDAFFELADSLRHAERYYLTIPDVGHNDYITQGNIRNERLYQLRVGDPKPVAARAKEKTALERARAGYQAVCVYILRFLEAKLKGDAAGADFLAKQYRDTKFGDGAPHVEYVPPGRTGPDPYREGGVLPPTPRQLRPLLREQGSKKAIALLRRFREEAATHPIFAGNFALFLVGDLLDQGRTEDALAFRDYYRESDLDCGTVFMKLGKGYQDMGLAKLAAAYYKRVLLLEPANREAADRLKELGEKSRNAGGR
jgi:pimeloyl-ACP methyl ester carboxylesterase